MTALGEHAARYLELRRAVGYRLRDHGPLLAGLVAYLEQAGCEHLTIEVTLAWASGARRDSTHQLRLSVARRFAAYLQAFDPATEIAPRGLGPVIDHRRRPPRIYTEAEIAALITAARADQGALSASSTATLIGLGVACGLRPAELYRLRCADVDLRRGQLAIMDSKGGRSRLLPLHPSTTDALAAHGILRRSAPKTDHDALFVTDTGTPLSAGFPRRFRRLVQAAGLAVQPGRLDRVGDLRHTFAVATLLGWHRDGLDVGRHLPALSAYLGHLRPESTYWYLEAVPELMAVVAQRVAHLWQEQP